MDAKVVVHFLDANNQEGLFKMESVVDSDSVRKFIIRTVFFYNNAYGCSLNYKGNIMYKFNKDKNVYYIGIFTK